MESKKAFKARLRREGRWKAFVAEREALKRTGMPPMEAFAKAAAAFKSNDEDETTSKTCLLQQPANKFEITFETWADKPEISLLENINWVRNHLAYKESEIPPTIAPSAAAWGLLLHARKDPQWFFQQMVVKTLPAKAQIDDLHRRENKGRPIIDLIDNLLAKLEQEKDELEDPNCPCYPPTQVPYNL